MTFTIRFGAVLGAVAAAWLLSGCSAPYVSKPAAGAKETCPYSPYAHPGDTENRYVDIPAPTTNETVDDVLIPGGQPVGCQNPRFRLVRGDDKYAHQLFERLTNNGAGWNEAKAKGIKYGGLNFLNDGPDAVRVRQSDQLAVGWRSHHECRRPLIWIFQWPDELLQKPGVKPVLLEFVGEESAENCASKKFHDGDGGGP